MSLVDIDIGGTNYKSYGSVVEVDKLLAVDPIRGATWAALDDDTKKIYAVAATNRLDLLNWQGEKQGGAAQDNAWPRSGLEYEDGTPVAGIPRALERAHALLAGSIAIRPGQADHGTSGQRISELKAGPVTIKYFTDLAVQAGVPVQDQTVHELVRQWLGGDSVYAPVASGTDAESSFSDRDSYGFRYGIG